jgi:hypothetical protein
MPEHKILVLGDHGHGHSHHDPQRSMNIACAVVITVVVIAMVIATIVYFCVNKPSGGGGGPTAQLGKVATPLDTPAMPIVQMAHEPQAQNQGIIFPKMDKDTEEELRASYQLDAVKNYANGQKNAIINDPKYSMIHDYPPLHKLGSAFVSARPKEDEMLFQAQTRQAKKFGEQFNQSEDQVLLRERNIVPYLS